MFLVVLVDVVCLDNREIILVVILINLLVFGLVVFGLVVYLCYFV